MAKKNTKSVWACSACGNEHAKWQGQCRACGEWNTLKEIAPILETDFITRTIPRTEQHRPIPIIDVETDAEIRIPLPDLELNRVLGGGLVPGSLILIGGEPGIGKSTLLLQLALQMHNIRILYVSGEESLKQIRLRAERLNPPHENLFVLAETQLESIAKAIAEVDPEILIVDSVQTIHSVETESAPGTLSQIRDCTTKLIRIAKERSLPVFLVGHINKEGLIAGPKLLEHMVDVVLEFEGDRRYDYRMVRSQKNRFGSTPELGVYEMRTEGLLPVSNPSLLFLPSSDESFAGVAVAATLQGSRTFLVEVQALVTPASYGTAQRSATGFDLRRLHMLVAVLEKKCQFKLADQDVFLNVAGGLKIDDPAVDLAVCCALASSWLDVPVPADSVFAAEVGLTGEVRLVGRIEMRCQEAARLGFKKIFVSSRQLSDAIQPSSFQIRWGSQLADIFRVLFGNF